MMTDISKRKTFEIKLSVPLPSGVTINQMEKMIREALVGIYPELAMMPVKKGGVCCKKVATKKKTLKKC